MPKAKTVDGVLKQTLTGLETDSEAALKLHDYVRDEIKFGFNKYFDASPPAYVLSHGYGHCNPKTRLLVSLLQAAGLVCHQHFVVISKEILRGAIPSSRFWMIPAEINHSYTDVKVNDKWCAIDSYIVDTPYLNGALDRLEQENRSLGYGVRTGSTNIWDGKSDAFSQFDHTLMIEDHGPVEDLEAYFQDARYRNHFFGIHFNTMFQWMTEFGVAPMNAHIEKIRN